MMELRFSSIRHFNGTQTHVTNIETFTGRIASSKHFVELAGVAHGSVISVNLKFN